MHIHSLTGGAWGRFREVTARQRAAAASAAPRGEAMRTRSGSHSGDVMPEAKDSRYPSDASFTAPLPHFAGDLFPLTRIAVKSVNRIAIVQVAGIIRLEAEDNYVRLWAERPYLHKETLTGLMARLDPLEFSCGSTARTRSTALRPRAAAVAARRVPGGAGRRYGTDVGPQLPRGHPGDVRTGLGGFARRHGRRWTRGDYFQQYFWSVPFSRRCRCSCATLAG